MQTSSSPSVEPELTRLYDQLARFGWWQQRLSRAGTRAMRKRLQPGQGELRGVEDLSAWLFDWLQPAPGSRVLDLGAGFGETLVRWAERDPGLSAIGLGLSGYQCQRARAWAAELGMQERLQFLQQANTQHTQRVFDLVLSVETLFHAADLPAVLSVAAAQLEAGGQLVLVEDMLREDARADGAVAELATRWRTPRLHRRADYLEAAAAAGLRLVHERDLSPLLFLRSPRARQRHRRRLGLLRALSPLGRPLLDAFLGGLAMEDLHAAGALEYRVMLLQREDA